MKGRDNGLEGKLRDIFARLKTQMPATLEAAGHVMAEQAALRAPDMAEEYETMQVGDGNPEGISNVPPMPSSIGGSDSDHRVRFYKPTENFLENVIRSNVVVSGLTVAVGDELLLDQTSRYQWRNITGAVFESDFPFWRAWEYGLGGSFVIYPRHQNSGRHGLPTLKPGLGLENQRFFMYKSIPRKRMYGGVDVDAVIENAIKPAIRNIARKA